MTDAPSATRDQPLIAIDVVPTSFSAGGGLRVATARRQYEPYVGRDALPGVLLDGAERLEEGARRALRTKAGIEAGSVRHLAQVGAFDGPSRDPRSAAISIAFLAVVDPASGGGSAVSVGAAGSAVAPDRPRWHPAVDAATRGLPFDHDAIIASALEHVRTRVWRDLGLTRALLGAVFTTADARALHLALTGTAPDPGNLNRALRTNPSLVQADRPAPAPARGGRPPTAWTWRD